MLNNVCENEIQSVPALCCSLMVVLACESLTQATDEREASLDSKQTFDQTTTRTVSKLERFALHPLCTRRPSFVNLLQCKTSVSSLRPFCVTIRLLNN